MARARRVARARTRWVTVVLVVVTFVVFCLSISIGDFPIPLDQVVLAVFGFGNHDSYFIVHTLRLPRALTGALVGGALGFSGTIFQSLAGNPLASPDILGITAGASTAAVFVIVYASGAAYGTVALGALGGGLLTAAIIYLLAYRRGVTPYRLILVGIGIAAVLQSITSYLMTRAQITDAAQAQVWLTGSLNGRGWEHVRPVAVAVALLFPAVLLLGRPLRVLQLGDDVAKGLGAAVERSRLALIAVAVALASVATASAGPISFVAFMAPSIARRLTRTADLALVPAAVTGGLLVLAADLAARKAFGATEFPVGVVTGVLGGPYLLWLLGRANRVGRSG